MTPTGDDIRLAPGPHLADVDGLRQRYHVHGSGPIAVVHPGGPGLAWEYMRMPEVERDLTLVYVEPIGTGASGRLDHPAGYTWARYARQVQGLADHLTLDTITLIGQSSGGFVAQRFAVDHPERVASLVLYDTTPVLDAEFGKDVMANVRAFPFRHPGHEAAVVDVLEAWAGQRAVRDDAGLTDVARRVFPLYFRDYWAQEDRLAPIGAAVRGWLAPQRAAGPVDFRAELPDIARPVLVVVGRHDFICGPRWSEMLQAAVPRADLVVLEDSGHFGHLESPDAFAAQVVPFVTAHAGTSRPAAGPALLDAAMCLLPRPSTAAEPGRVHAR